MAFKTVVFLALFAYSYGFTIPAEYALSLDDNNSPAEFQIVYVPTHPVDPISEDDEVVINRMRRQVYQAEPLKDGQHGRVGVTGEQIWRNHKNMGTDFNVEATGLLWQSQDGRSTVTATANYNRHLGEPVGTPKYWAFANFEHRF